MLTRTLCRTALFVGVLGIAALPAARADRAVFDTDAGQIVVELDDTGSPASAKSFVTYARDGVYDNTLLHRVVPGLLVQGGEFAVPSADTDLQRIHPQAPVTPFDPDYRGGRPNRRGTLAMARTAAPTSVPTAPTGFFFNLADNPHFDYRRFDKASSIQTPRGEFPVPAGTEVRGYSVIGRVVKGWDVLEALQKAETTEKYPHRHWPVAPVTVQRVQILP